MVSLGRPLGSVVRPLLLQRTTVSRQEHSAGHLSTGEQLFSSLPDWDEWIDGGAERRGKDNGKSCYKENTQIHVQSFYYSLHLTIFTSKVLDSYILDGDLFQKVWILAARVTRDNAFPSQPVTEPSQVAVAVERVGQKVTGGEAIINAE